MKKQSHTDRRKFLRQSGILTAASFLTPEVFGSVVENSAEARSFEKKKEVQLNGHLWVYASKFPPNWDCTPNLEAVFSDLSYAGIQGVELMEPNLRHDHSVKLLQDLSDKYQLPVSGSSYGVGFNMWKKEEHSAILKDVEVVVPRLSEVGGKTFGISVGHHEGLKTEQELDDQAELLLKVRRICHDNGIEANLHNHTYEVENGMHDLKGTLKRIPDLKLGPDVNWLIRAGIDPVEFITSYGSQIVYLHIRDQYKDGTWTEYVGQGDTDFKGIARALNEQEFKGQAAIELAFPDGFILKNPLKEDWKRSAKFVRSTFDWA